MKKLFILLLLILGASFATMAQESSDVVLSKKTEATIKKNLEDYKKLIKSNKKTVEELKAIKAKNSELLLENANLKKQLENCQPKKESFFKRLSKKIKKIFEKKPDETSKKV